MKSKIVAALAIALAATVVWLAWSAWFGAKDSRQVASAVTATARAGRESNEKELEPVAAASDETNAISTSHTAESRAPVESDAAVESTLATRSKSPTGQLVIDAIDATTREPLRSLAARIASDTRIAEASARDKAGELEVVLTSGTYSIVVSSPGYESLELPKAQVVAEETTRLEPAALREGFGRIAVDCVGDVPEGRTFEVQLIGSGRRPCEACAESDDPSDSTDRTARKSHAWSRSTPCKSCGFASESSSFSFSFAKRVEFANLASGNYALRVVDEHDQCVAPPRELQLREGEAARVEFELASVRYVELEWFDVDGRSLSEAWRERMAATKSNYGVMTVVGAPHSNALTLTFLDATRHDVAKSWLLPPRESGSTVFRITPTATYSGRRGGARDRADWTRSPNDALWPELAAAHFENAEISCELRASGLAYVGPLPTKQLELRVTTNHFACEAIVPESKSMTRVAVELHLAETESKHAPDFATFAELEASIAK